MTLPLAPVHRVRDLFVLMFDMVGHGMTLLAPVLRFLLVVIQCPHVLRFLLVVFYTPPSRRRRGTMVDKVQETIHPYSIRVVMVALLLFLLCRLLLLLLLLLLHLVVETRLLQWVRFVRW